MFWYFQFSHVVMYHTDCRWNLTLICLYLTLKDICLDCFLYFVWTSIDFFSTLVLFSRCIKSFVFVCSFFVSVSPWISTSCPLCLLRFVFLFFYQCFSNVFLELYPFVYVLRYLFTSVFVHLIVLLIHISCVLQELFSSTAEAKCPGVVVVHFDINC